MAAAIYGRNREVLAQVRLTMGHRSPVGSRSSAIDIPTAMRSAIRSGAHFVQDSALKPPGLEKSQSGMVAALCFFYVAGRIEFDFCESLWDFGSN